MKRSLTGLIIALALATNYAAAQHPTSATNAGDTSSFPTHGSTHRIIDSLKANLKEPLTPKPLKWKAIVVPAALIGYGTLSVASGWLDDVNLLGRRWASANEDPNRKTSVDDYLEYAPAIAVYGLNIACIRGKHNVVDETMLYAMSQGIAHLIT